MISSTHCLGTKADGAPCMSSLGLSTTGFCLNHDPDRIDAAREVRAAGGRARAAARRGDRPAVPDDIPPPPRTLEDAVRYFAWITHAVTSGRLDARTGHEAAYALAGFRAAAEKRDLQREIAALRKQLDDLKKAPRRVS